MPNSVCIATYDRLRALVHLCVVMLAWMSSWINSQVASGLRCFDTHVTSVTVMGFQIRSALGAAEADVYKINDKKITPKRKLASQCFNTNLICLHHSLLQSDFPLCTEFDKFFLENTKNEFTFSIISWNCNDSGKTRIPLSYMVNHMTADGLATQGARASAVMLLT